jgi:DNA-binding LacI/PurR family transcriptional regulator
MPRKPRIKDIAKKVGCSTATVSQAFNNPKLVNRKTRARILEVCEELGYTRKRFSHKRKKVIGVTGISHEILLGEYYNKVTTSILSAAKEQGFNVVIESFSEEEDTLPHMFSKKTLDGVIVLGKVPRDRLLQIKQHRLPLVLCGHPSSGAELNTVLPDGRKGMYEIAKHLIKLGHKNFGYVSGGPVFDPLTSDRLDGFRFALSEAGLSLPDDHIAPANFCSWDTATRAVAKLMNLKDRPTAIVCESDALAYTTYQRLQELGLKIPKDISVTGFDNIPFPPYVNKVKPNLTTVDVSLEGLGRTAVNTLLDIIENPSRTAYRHTLPVQIIVGGTTGKVR